MATPKQVSLCLRLLGQCGYETKWMSSSFKTLGATMKERSGSVSGWLENKSNADISALIDDLQERIAKRELKENQAIESALPEPLPEPEYARPTLANAETEEIRIIDGCGFVHINGKLYSDIILKDLAKKVTKINKSLKPKPTNQAHDAST